MKLFAILAGFRGFETNPEPSGFWVPRRRAHFLGVQDAADFECPTKPAKGIDCVLVNGRSVWENGEATGNRPGRALRHGG